MGQLRLGNPVAIAQKCLGQHDDVAAIGRPLRGFVERQRYVMVGAAAATPYAGKLGVHYLDDPSNR